MDSVKPESENSHVSTFGEHCSGPDSSTSQVTPQNVVVVIVTAVAVLGALYVLWQVREVIMWCIIAIFIALALDPAVNWLQRWCTRRITAILLAYLGLLLGMLVMMALL